MAPLVLLLALQSSDVDVLLAKWKSASLLDQEEATEQALAKWRDWTDADLAAIEKAARDFKAAGEALDRIRLRRRLGARIVAKFREADAWALGGEAREHTKLLGAVIGAWAEGRLEEADVKTVVDLALERKWRIAPETIVSRPPHPQLQRLVPLLLSSPDAGTRALALARAGLDSAERLTALLDDRDAGVRRAAVERLQHLDLRDAAARLPPLFQDRDANVRAAAIHAHGWLGGRDAEAITRCLKDGDAGVRIVAAGALATLGGEANAKAIEPLFEDAETIVREIAVTAYGLARGKDGVERLRALADHRSTAVRGAAVIAIARADPGADLAAFEGNDDEDVRVVAAVAKIGAKPRDRQARLIERVFTGRRLDIVQTRWFLLERLAAAHEPDLAARIETLLTTKNTVETMEDAVRELDAAGLKLEVPAGAWFDGRIAAGRTLKPRELLGRVKLANGDWPTAVPDRGRVLLLSSTDAAAGHWLRRLAE